MFVPNSRIMYFFKFNLFSFKTLKWKELAIIIIGLLIIEIPTYLITNFSSTPDNENGLNAIVDQSNIFIAIMTLGIFIPVIEECIFRGILIKVIFQKKQWLGVVFSIILFTIAHNPTSLTEYIIYGIPAIIYSIIYYKTQRIKLPIIIHVINNFLGINATFYCFSFFVIFTNNFAVFSSKIVAKATKTSMIFLQTYKNSKIFKAPF